MERGDYLLDTWSWEHQQRSLWRRELATGVRMLTPYTDAALWHWARTLRPSDRLGVTKGRLWSKLALRSELAHQGRLPERFVWRPKLKSFDGVIEQMWRGSARELNALISSPLLLDELGLIHSDRLRQVYRAAQEHTAYAPDQLRLMWLWRVVAAERWLRAL
jgi:hypothetical protein